MLVSELLEATGATIDFDPTVNRHLAILHRHALTGQLDQGLMREFTAELESHRHDAIRLYYATLVDNKTSRMSLSGSRRLILSFDPHQALRQAQQSHRMVGEFVVYAVTVRFDQLRPCLELMNRARQTTQVGYTVADSLVHTGCVAVKHQLNPSQFSVYGYFDREGNRVSHKLNDRDLGLGGVP